MRCSTVLYPLKIALLYQIYEKDWRNAMDGKGRRAQGGGRRAEGAGHRAKGEGQRAEGAGRWAEGRRAP